MWVFCFVVKTLEKNYEMSLVFYSHMLFRIAFWMRFPTLTEPIKSFPLFAMHIHNFEKEQRLVLLMKYLEKGLTVSGKQNFLYLTWLSMALRCG